VMAFVDDFFSAAPSQMAQQNVDLFKDLLKTLGFFLKEEKETPPTQKGPLLGVEVSLRENGAGSFSLSDTRRKYYLARVQQVLKDDYISPGDAAKLAGALCFASSVTLAKLGRPFLQPLYAAASMKQIPEFRDLADELVYGVWLQGPKGKALPSRLRNALEWWTQLLTAFPSSEFLWDAPLDRPLNDVFTDASAERRWEGLGGVIFLGGTRGARTVRCLTPEVLEPFLPSKESQKVRISQLELLAVLVTLHAAAPLLRNSLTRFHIDNLAAMYCLINCYSGNAFMARLSAAVWAILLEYRITPFFDYVPSKENVSDVFSRPDLVAEGDLLTRKWKWRSLDPTPSFLPLSQVLQTSPKDAWINLFSRLYSGAQGT
jgi:hypothetical protein